MGALHSTCAKQPRSPGAPAAPKTLKFSARCEDVSDEFLKRVCAARATGALHSVTLDCSRSEFDEVQVDRVQAAAGGKVVLYL